MEIFNGDLDLDPNLDVILNFMDFHRFLMILRHLGRLPLIPYFCKASIFLILLCFSICSTGGVPRQISKLSDGKSA